MKNIDVFNLVCGFFDSEITEKELAYEIVSRKNELDFNDWSIIHCELAGKIPALDALSSNMMKLTADSFEKWADVYFFIECQESKDLATIEMKKIGNIDDWLDLLFGNHGTPYEANRDRKEIIEGLLQDPGLNFLIGDNYTINDWCCHYDEYNDKIPDLIKNLAGKASADLKSWWTAYDIYEYDKTARAIIIAEMKKIEDIEGWYDIFIETRGKVEDYGEESELYNAALEMESKLEMTYYRFAMKKS